MHHEAQKPPLDSVSHSEHAEQVLKPQVYALHQLEQEGFGAGCEPHVEHPPQKEREQVKALHHGAQYSLEERAAQAEQPLHASWVRQV